MNKIDVTDEIKKYKELLDIGAITQEEYDNKKNELLHMNDKETECNNSIKNNNKFVNETNLEELQMERAKLQAEKLLKNYFYRYLEKNEQPQLYIDEIRNNIINEIGKDYGCLVGEVATNLYFNVLKEFIDENCKNQSTTDDELKVGNVEKFINKMCERIQSNPKLYKKIGKAIAVGIFCLILIIFGNKNKVEDKNIVLEEDSLANNIVIACKDIGLDLSQIKNFKKVETGGYYDTYEFVYKSNGFTVSCNSDNTVNKIQTGIYTPYLAGFEPINAEKFIVDGKLATDLAAQTQNHVKYYLNYPNTADFALFGWGYGRCEDIYAISGSLTAENAFGVEDKISFYAEYEVGQRKRLVYLKIDGQVMVGKQSFMKEFDRVEIKQENATDNKIVLIDGTVGEFGERVMIDEYEDIWYHIPEGKYWVSSNVKFCKVYVAKNKTIINSDGYEESVVVQTLTFDNNSNDKQELEITEGQHISITVGSKVTLERQ